MTKQLKRPEVLAPAGTLEKLKVAVRYGADAVFIGGQAYGLRSRAGNFTFEQMEEGVQFAAQFGASANARRASFCLSFRPVGVTTLTDTY